MRVPKHDAIFQADKASESFGYRNGLQKVSAIRFCVVHIKREERDSRR